MESHMDERMLIAIGIDERVFDKESLLYSNALFYGKRFKETHIIARATSPRESEQNGTTSFHPIFSRSSLFFPFRAYRYGRRLIARTQGPILVVADNPFEVGLISFFLSRRGRGRLFVQVHTDLMSPFFRRSSWKERIRFWCARFVLPRADLVRVVSKRIETSLVETRLVAPERIARLPIFTDTKRFMNARKVTSYERALASYRFRIIAVGRFVDKEKQFSMLFPVMKELVRSVPDAFLLLVGYGPDKEYYLRLSKEYRLEKHVMIGTETEIHTLLSSSHDAGGEFDVPGSEGAILPSLYKSFHVCVIPSNFEGWGRVGVEALASGLPVVMTDVGLAREVVEDGKNGIIVPVGAQKELLRSLVRLSGDHSLRESLTRAAAKTSFSFLSRSQEAYRETYSRLLESAH